MQHWKTLRRSGVIIAWYGQYDTYADWVGLGVQPLTGLCKGRVRPCAGISRSLDRIILMDPAISGAEEGD